ncbi:MAG: hypothetical protein H7A46_22995 [Verrucomicrobiales bacterium]|nr:hypothetical protein [Verrucomicrobiales bacterium]
MNCQSHQLLGRLLRTTHGSRRRFGVPSRTPVLCLGLYLASGLLFGSLFAAVPVLKIDVGTIPLQPNLAGQPVTLDLKNEEPGTVQVQGFAFRVEVVEAGSTPAITGVELVDGTPWQGVSLWFPPVYSSQEPHYWDVQLAANPSTGAHAEFAPSSLTQAALLTFDTTGLSSGSWELRLTDHILYPGDTAYSPYDPGSTIPEDEWPVVAVNGQIVIVPEPADTSLILALIAAGWCVVGRRAARRRHD